MGESRAKSYCREKCPGYDDRSDETFLVLRCLNMPRHAIRQPKGDLDLTTVFIETPSIPETITSRSLFGNDFPLEIEVGSGKGLFLSQEVFAKPHHNFIGIEIIGKYAKHATARLIKAHRRHVDELDSAGNSPTSVGPPTSGSPPNVRMFATDALALFETRIPVNSLEAIHIYFPDPWWKKKHRKRRVVNEACLMNYVRALRSGGRLHFWTDVLDYFEDTVEMIAELAPNLGVPIPESIVEANHDLDYRTHFERRSRKERIPVYRVRYEKK